MQRDKEGRGMSGDEMVMVVVVSWGYGRSGKRKSFDSLWVIGMLGDSRVKGVSFFSFVGKWSWETSSYRTEFKIPL